MKTKQIRTKIEKELIEYATITPVTSGDVENMLDHLDNTELACQIGDMKMNDGMVARRGMTYTEIDAIYDEERDEATEIARKVKLDERGADATPHFKDNFLSRVSRGTILLDTCSLDTVLGTDRDAIVDMRPALASVKRVEGSYGQKAK